MKKRLLLSLLIILLMNNLAAQEVRLEPAGEMQISGGAEFGFGAFKVDNKNEKSTFAFFAPGISLSVRYFTDKDSAISSGFFFRDRAIFITNGEYTGTAYLNGSPFSISESYSIADDNSFMGILDFDLGLSTRYIISKNLQFYADLGVNFTIMNLESEDDTKTLNYWGGGLYAALALQVNLTKTMYLEFGINSIINAFSSQNGKLYNATYEDTGRWDLTTVAAYINIGWRLDVQRISIKNSTDE